MKLIPYPDAEKPCGFHTDDPAALYLYAKKGAVEPPEEFQAVYLAARRGSGSQTTIKFRDLEFMAPALFGEPRPSKVTNSNWTGDAYKFAIYRNTNKYGPPIVILRTDGGGFYAYAIRDLCDIELWELLTAQLPHERLWDLCMELTRTYECGIEDGRTEITTAFLDGSLKKKKVRGQESYRVVIERN